MTDKPRYIPEQYPNEPPPRGYHVWQISASGVRWFRRNDLRQPIKGVPPADDSVTAGKGHPVIKWARPVEDDE